MCIRDSNNDGYFVFDGNDGMTGPPSNSFGLSQTDHTIEIVLMNTTITNQTIINFKGNGGDAYAYGINSHMPWGNNNIYYDVGGCCGGTNRINGAVNILNQKAHVILRSKPSGSNRRQVFLNGNSILGSGGNSTSNPGFTNGVASIGFISGHGHYYKGRLYSVRVYNRALTDHEIANNYAYYQNPRNISISSNTVTENTSIGTTIGNFSSTGMNQNGILTYTLASSGDAQDDDNGSFTISGTTLILNSSPDYETKASYNIYIDVNDGANNYAKAFTVSVTNVNEAPTDLGLATSSLLENGLLIYLDSRNPNSYSGSGSTWSDLSGNQNHFTVKGGMTYNSTNGFRFEANNTTKYAYKTSFNHPSTTYTDEFILKTSTNNYGAFKFYGVSGLSLIHI